MFNIKRLSANFSWPEFIHSDTAVSKGINNNPKNIEDVQNNAIALCANVLQKVRDKFGPIIITSGYSCPELAQVLSRKPTSQHCKGQAADIVSNRYANFELAVYIRDNLEFDQLIYEVRKRKSGNLYDWVHVSYCEDRKNRKEVLYSPVEGGYKKGLPEKGID